VGEVRHDRDMERKQPLAKRATATTKFLNQMRYNLKAEKLS
jgi:hypothetical protein